MVEHHPYTVDTGVQFSNEVPRINNNMNQNTNNQSQTNNDEITTLDTVIVDNEYQGMLESNLVAIDILGRNNKPGHIARIVAEIA